MRQKQIDLSAPIVKTITFTLPGKPIPWARPGFSAKRGYDQQLKLKRQYRLILQQQLPSDYIYTDAPKSLLAIFFMPIPNYAPKFKKEALNSNPYPHFKRPDLDNLIKFLLDIGNGILYSDDSLIAHIDAHKIYNQNPRTQFTLIDVPEFVKI